MSLSIARSQPGGSSLEDVLVERLKQRPESALDVRAKVALDVRGDAGWTVAFDRDRTSLSFGVDDDADLVVTGDADTLASIVDGTVWGIEAFVEGRIVVRRNLALSLRMASLFDGVADHHFHKAVDVDAGGIRTFFIEAGQGPPVVLLHGLGATNTSLLPTFLELCRDHRVIAPDLPGFGDTDKPIRSYDPEFFADWLLSFMDAVSLERADLVGNSMGGRVAVEAALRAPERVGRVALLAPSSAFIKGRQYERIVRFLRPELALLPLPLPRRQVVGSIRRLFSKPERLRPEWYESAADEFLRVFTRPRGRIAFFSAARQIYLEQPYGERGFWDRLPELSRPALFVWGEKDWLVPARFERHVERCLPNATSIVLEDCGHVPQYELPEATHKLVREFLGGHDRGA
ncbi:MAG TPA: alpha/beta fold hydrolase [Actinomycetota bacterium]|nr:alpha/beta fold hydrolase [Actinomycetota bacterium]